MKDYRALARAYHTTLAAIAKVYMTPEQIRRAIERPHSALYGLAYDEALEMVLDNLQAEAAAAIAGKRRP